MQSLFWVCLRSILNTRLSVTFSFRKKQKKQKDKLAFYSTDTNLLEADITGVENGLARSNDRHTPPHLFSTIRRRIFLLQGLKINKQK